VNLKDVGGTPGGFRTFLLGIAMIAVGGYLLMQQVSVYGGYWNFGWAGGYGRSFGVTLIPLLFGIGILFFDGRSFAGRLLTGLGALFILTGVIVNLDIHIRETSMFNIILTLVLLVGGIDLVVRAVLPMQKARDDDQ
jgi:hypothetical protein